MTQIRSFFFFFLVTFLGFSCAAWPGPIPGPQPGGNSGANTIPTVLNYRGALAYSTGGRVVRYKTETKNTGPARLAATDSVADGWRLTASAAVACSVSTAHYSSGGTTGLITIHTGTFTEANTDQSATAHGSRSISANQVGGASTQIALSSGESIWVSHSGTGAIDTAQDPWYQLEIICQPR